MPVNDENTKKYTSPGITVYWRPDRCIHSTNCVKGLPSVFRPDRLPWIDLSGASAEEIASVIDRCPSGALSYKMMEEPNQFSSAPPTKILVMEKGPLVVKGTCSLVIEEGVEVAISGPVALCRCGRSKKKPYCDGSHELG